MKPKSTVPNASPTPAALVVLWWQGFLLAVSRRNDPDDLNLPGGKIEDAEEPAAAASRELMEETGVRIDPLRMAKVLEAPEATPSGRLVHVFSAQWTDVRPPVIKAEKGMRVVWVRPERLLHSTCSFQAFNARLFASMGLLVESTETLVHIATRLRVLERVTFGRHN